MDFLKHKIASVKAQIASIEKSIFQVKTAFEGFNQKFTDDAAETFDFSYSSPKAATRRKISISPLTKGTASGGILHSSSSISVPLLPNFQVNNEENHYNSHTFEDDLSVRLDHSLEKIGCCRSNFFCF